MCVYCWNGYTEQCCDELLGKPNRFVLIPGLNALITRLPGKNQELGCTVAYQLFSFVFILFHDESSGIKFRADMLSRPEVPKVPFYDVNLHDIETSQQVNYVPFAKKLFSIDDHRACPTNGSDCGSLRSLNLTSFVGPSALPKV